MNIPRPHTMTKDSLISLSVMAAIAGVIFMAGAYYNKITHLEDLHLDQQLIGIKVDLALIKQRLGIPDTRPVSASTKP